MGAVLQRPNKVQPKHLSCYSKINQITRQDEEDSGNEGQDGAMGPDVADVAEHKANEHEEEADQREGCGRADHLWKQTGKAHQLF